MDFSTRQKSLSQYRVNTLLGDDDSSSQYYDYGGAQRDRGNFHSMQYQKKRSTAAKPYAQESSEASTSRYELESSNSSEGLVNLVKRSTNETLIFRENKMFLVALILTLSCGGFQMGHVIACTNQVTSTFEAKFEQFRIHSTFYTTLLGSSGIFGTTLGAISGGQVIRMGRRLTFILASVIGLVGCMISMFEYLNLILLGRFIYGIGCGLLSIACGRFLEETVPEHLISFYQPIFMTSTAVGTMMSLLLGAGLPDDSNPIAQMDDGFWRVILGMPMLLQVASILSMIFYIRYDSIRFSIGRQNYIEAREMIRQVYDPSEKENHIIEYIETSSQKDTSGISIRETLTNPLYKRATLVALAVICFHEMTGENAIILYSTEIFKKMASYQDGDNAMSPRTGTMLIGVFNLLAHIPAVYLIKKLPRRTLLVWGHLIMGGCHFLVAIFAASGSDGGVICMVLLYMITYVITNGPIIWLYISEIVVDSALGVCLFVLWSMILLLSIFTAPLMDSFLKPTGVFLIFSVSSLWGAHFAWRSVKET